MSTTILTGTLSTIDVTMGGTSVKDAFAQLSCQITRQGFPVTTFSNIGWVAEITGMKQMSGSLVGFAIKGSTYADPLLWVGATGTTAFVGTADTSCTVSASLNVFGDGFGLVAAGPSSRGVDFRSTGAVTTAWVTS